MSTAPSASQILQSITNTSVTSGWDVVSAISAPALNSVLVNQFVAHLAGGVTLGPYSGSVLIIDQIYVQFENLTLGPPLVGFSPTLNPQDVEISMPFLSGMVNVVQIAGGVTTVQSSQIVTPASGYSLTAIVPLASIQGEVNQQQVQIDFPNGYNASAQIGVTGAAATTLGTYFQKLISQDWKANPYALGTLVFDPGSTNLVPVMFEFATQVDSSESGDPGRLLLFIATAYNPKGGSSQTLGVANPVPAGYTTALIVSSQVFFQNLLQPALTQQLQSVGVSFSAAPLAAGGASAWSISSGGSANVGAVTKTYNPSNFETSTVFTCSHYDGLDSQATPVEVPMSTLSVTPGADGGSALSASLNAGWSQGFCSLTPEGALGAVPSSGSMPMTATSTTVATPQVSSSTDVVSFNDQVNVSVNYTQQSWWKKVFFDAQTENEMFAAIQSQTNNKLQSFLQFQVPDVNTFAVANLLFPGQQILSFQSANVPGDLIVFGSVQNTGLSVSPNYVTLTNGQTQQYTVSEAVTWSIPGQSAFTGSISSGGLYTAPAKVRKPTMVVIIAASASSSSVTAAAVVSLVPDAIIVSPYFAQIVPGAGVTQPFTASLAGNADPSVTWSAGAGGGGITAAGVYTPPAVTAPTAVTVTAASSNPAASGSALVFLFPATPSAIAVTPPISTKPLSPSQSLQFAAALGASPAECTWTILPAGAGSISPSGLYLAPSAISEPTTVMVIATYTEDTYLFGTAVVLLEP